ALAAELRSRLAEWLAVARQTMETALRGFTKLQSITGHKGFATAKDPAPAEIGKAMREAAPKFEVWVSEALNKYKASFPTEKAKPPTPPTEEPKEMPEPQEKEKEVVYKGDPKEILHLKQVTQRQQEEISKLLLTIDELRKRLENIRVVSLDAGPGVASAVDNVMDRVGLKDIMDPGFTGGLPRNPPVLKGVFERLYSDAIQRIQRYSLIRQQMLLANKAYASVVDAITDLEEPNIPDFDGLNDTTDTTIRGMWYQTEYLFRRACEYAMSQGVEASLVKGQQTLISEFEGLDPEKISQLEEKAGLSLPRKERLPRRERVRQVKEERGLPGKARKDDQPSPFSCYMAALREVGNESKESPEEKTERRKSNDLNPKTLKAACDRSGGPLLSTSHSLPALPKGRSMLQADDGVSPSKVRMAASLS
ncbi:unnamed protein product, partial [Effrenium voratum]